MRHYTRLYIVKYYLHLQFGLLYELLDHIFGSTNLGCKIIKSTCSLHLQL